MSALTMSLDQPLVIPDDFLRALHLSKADKVKVRLQGNSIVVEPEAMIHPRLVVGEDGLSGLEADPRSPMMTPELIRDLLND